MDSDKPEISIDVPPYLRIYKDGTLERIAGTQVVPPGLHTPTNVISKDILIIPQTRVTARVYLPNSAANNTSHNHHKLPLLVYFHGGAFCISSTADPVYHNSLNNLVAEANIVAVSVNYRLVPEHPLPTAYEDSWDALKWVVSHAREEREDHERWLKDIVDFKRVFIGGDSAGANITHFMALRLHDLDLVASSDYFKVCGLIMVNPYFWGKEPIGVEIVDKVRKEMVDKWWDFVCPSEKGNDDPMINPFVEEAQDLEGLGCNKVLVTVAENDILGERGRLYYRKLSNCGWKGRVEIYETEGEDHVFHIFNPDCDKAKNLIKRLASFINNE